jgi:allantoate deiminase
MPAIWSPRWADGGLPGAANVIPGEVRFTLDVRSGDEARRDRAAEAILAPSALPGARAGCGDRAIHDLPASPARRR